MATPRFLIQEAIDTRGEGQVSVGWQVIAYLVLWVLMPQDPA